MLSKLEAKVRQLRRGFTHQILKKNFWESEEQVNKLFDSGMHANVNNIMRTFEKRNFTTNLSKAFDEKMTIDQESKRSKEAQQGA